ncbi:hypothetical protein [Enterococcus sp. S86.2]|uniref:hypothetical protein n=1 Tax=Enterococcus sp. S86.2 TaxID=3031299 RepID=UPI0026F30253|nr:hypothetical protein [Enterococcus sp. S86.2]
MGTSSSFTGPEKNPLLPEDFDDNSWQNTKTEFGKFLNSTGGNPSRLFGKFVKASGGHASLAKSATGGKAGFIGLVDLFNHINTVGLLQTLSDFRISSEGKSLVEIISELAGQISPKGSTKEESVARQATLDTMSSFYMVVEESGLGIEQLDSISGEVFDDLLCEYFVNYITGLLLKDLGYGVEKFVDDPSKLAAKEQDLRDYVDAKIYVLLKNSELNQDPRSIVNQVFNATMEIVGGNYE